MQRGNGLNLKIILLNRLLNDFEFTNNPDDFIKSQDLQDWLTNGNKGISIKRLAVDLKKYISKHKLDNVVNKLKSWRKRNSMLVSY